VTVHVPTSAHEVPLMATTVALFAACAQPRFKPPAAAGAHRRGVLVGIGLLTRMSASASRGGRQSAGSFPW
jgi:hypothetical protein